MEQPRLEKRPPMATHEKWLETATAFGAAAVSEAAIMYVMTQVLHMPGNDIPVIAGASTPVAMGLVKELYRIWGKKAEETYDGDTNDDHA